MTRSGSGPFVRGGGQRQRSQSVTGIAGLAGLALLLGLAATSVDAASTAGELLGDVVSYDNHKVLRVLPATQAQVSALGRLLDAAAAGGGGGGDVDVWSKAREAGVPWDVMVSPRRAAELRAALDENQLKWELLIPDVASTLPGRAAPHLERASGASGARELGAPRTRSSSSSGTTGTPRYLRHKEMVEYLNDLAKRYPEMVTTKSIGKSSEGRDLRLIHISTVGAAQAEDKDKDKAEARAKDKVGDKAKARPAIWIDAGIHAREWIAPATALYIVNQLVENATHTAHLTSDVDWYILPLMNPDGYEFCHTTDRLWRKTRSKTWWGLGCAGADANRNFDFHWREVGASWAACSYTYAGSKPFSEPESRAVRDFLLANKDQIKMYLTYHSYGNFLLYPWGYTNTLPDDWQTLDSLAKKANAAMVAAGSDNYTIGSSTNVLYAAAGGSDDWAKGVAGIPLSYTIELPGGNGHGFDLPPSYIPSVGRHQMQLIDVFASHVAQLGKDKKSA